MDIDLSGGACVGMGAEGDTFFTADDFTHPELTERERKVLNTERRLRAKIICKDCAVKPLCLLAGATHDFGTWGGVNDTLRVRGKDHTTRGSKQPMRGNAAAYAHSFKRGATVAEIAEDFDVLPGTVTAALRAVLYT